jgi:hypothetical protein
MASALENWDNADPAGSFRQFVEELRQQARTVFLKDGTHVELLFLVDDHGKGELVGVAGTDRPTIVRALKQRIRDRNIYGVVHIAEGWAYYPRGAKDHTMRQILEGEIKVSELRPEDRGEALIVHTETREGENKMWVSPIRRDAGKVTLGEPIHYPEPPSGGMAGLFGSP